MLTYTDLHRETCRFANVLKRNGIVKGDRIIIYMPMVPEAAIAMLACARIGATHSVVFGGFSAQALIDRIHDCGAKMVITADGGYRRGTTFRSKRTSTTRCPNARRTSKSSSSAAPTPKFKSKRAATFGGMRNWSTSTRIAPPKISIANIRSSSFTPAAAPANRRACCTRTAGYLLGVYLTTKYVFDLKEQDTFWCTADIGWVTGHSYSVYGALANGATTLMYEGAPNWPEPDRFWRIIDKYKVTILYTAPTAIRAFMRWGDQWPNKHDLSSLRLLGTVGEPINPEAWMWYHNVIGQKRCPIVDTWWQTETGCDHDHAVARRDPHQTRQRHTAVLRRRCRGRQQARQGTPAERRRLPRHPPSVAVHAPHHLRRPGTLSRTSIGARSRTCYFTGDGCRRDKDGYFWIVGRIDDVLNVAGHRIGTAEVESALVSPPESRRGRRGGPPRRAQRPGPRRLRHRCAAASKPRPR